MLGSSRMLWQLLLGSVLLLGQLTCGAEGCCERQERLPEDRCCERHEPPPRCCEDLERLREEECCTRQRRPVEPERCREEPPLSEERGEEDFWGDNYMANLQRRQLEKALAAGTVVIPEYFKQMAVSHYNGHSSGPYYRHLEDTHLKVKKAIGTMAYLRLLLEKTDCSRDRERERHVTYTNEYLDALACGLPSESDREKLDCTFGIFMDARSGREAIVSHECIHLRNAEELTSEDFQ